MLPAAVSVKRLVVGRERSVASFIKVFNPDGPIQFCQSVQSGWLDLSWSRAVLFSFEGFLLVSQLQSYDCLNSVGPFKRCGPFGWERRWRHAIWLR